MRLENRVRDYRDALIKGNASPCDCLERYPSHVFQCAQGRMLIDNAIRTLTWVLGESNELDAVVDRFIIGNGGQVAGAMKAIEDLTQPELHDLTSSILDSIASRLPEESAFAVLFWPIGTHNVAQYGSNCARPDMIKALRETADRLERRQDVPR